MLNDPKLQAELDEDTALKLCMLINNQIASLQMWERKLRRPYMPVSNKVLYLYRYEPTYPKPTLQTAFHVALAATHVATEMLEVCKTFHVAKG